MDDRIHIKVGLLGMAIGLVMVAIVHFSVSDVDTARQRAVAQGKAHWHPTVRDSLVYTDPAVRIIVEGK